MKVVQVSVSESDFKKYFGKRYATNFNDLKEKVLTIAFQKSIDKSLRLASKNG